MSAGERFPATEIGAYEPDRRLAPGAISWHGRLAHVMTPHGDIAHVTRRELREAITISPDHHPGLNHGTWRVDAGQWVHLAGD